MSNEKLPAPIIDDGNGNGENPEIPKLQEWIEEAEKAAGEHTPETPPAE
jgi:hypothetical protein